MSNSLKPPWTVAPHPRLLCLRDFPGRRLEWMAISYSRSRMIFETIWCHFRGSEELLYPSSLCLRAEKNSVRGKVIDKKCYQNKMLVRFTVGWAKGCHTPKNLLRYSFIIKGKVGRVRTFLSFLSRRHASVISSSLARLPSGKTGIITVFRTYLIGWLWGLNWVTTCKILRKVPGTLKATSE